MSIRVPLSVICYSLPFSFCPFQSSPFVCQHLRRVILVIADALWLTLQGSLQTLISFLFSSSVSSHTFLCFCEKGNFPTLITGVSEPGGLKVNMISLSTDLFKCRHWFGVSKLEDHTNNAATSLIRNGICPWLFWNTLILVIWNIITENSWCTS